MIVCTHVLNLRTTLQCSVLSSRTGGWKEWSSISDMLSAMPVVSGIDAGWNRRHPSVRATLSLHLASYLRELSYVKEEDTHRTFLRMATRAILLYTINGDVGDLDASDARLDLLDSTLTWHDQRAMEVELHWITPLKSSLIKIVRRLRELRRRVMAGEWSVGEDGKHGKEATSSLGGTVAEQCAWWYVTECKLCPIFF